MPEHTEEEVRGYIGNGVRKLIERAVPRGSSQETAERALSAFFKHYTANSTVLTAPYDGIPELLFRLKERGIRLGVVSNKTDPAVRPIIEHYFPNTFDFAVGEREGIRKKPAPDSLNECMQVLGSDRLHTLYVGDSDVDMLTAQNAQTHCVLVSWGYRDRALLEAMKPCAVIDTADELLSYLDGALS